MTKKPWNPLDIAWVAGILEGEGCFNVSNQRQTRIIVSMTDEDVIRRLHDVTGVGRVTGPSVRKPPRKTVWHWTVGRRDQVARLLLAVYPMMGERRRRAVAPMADRLVEMERRSSFHVRHGTYNGYMRERKAGLVPCVECKAAHKVYSREYYRARRRRKLVA